MLAAALLTDKPVTLENIPLIEDVTVMLQLLEALGLEIDQMGIPSHSAHVQLPIPILTQLCALKCAPLFC